MVGESMSDQLKQAGGASRRAMGRSKLGERSGEGLVKVSPEKSGRQHTSAALDS